MATVTWTDQALDDLDAICEFIARDRPRQANLLAERMFEATMYLELFPRLGRVVPERGQDHIRELIVWTYRVIYRINADRIEIVTVLHGARRLGEIPGE